MTSSQRKQGELVPKLNCWVANRQEHSSRQSYKECCPLFRGRSWRNGRVQGYLGQAWWHWRGEKPCMTWPLENGQLKGDCSSRDEDKPAGCPCSQSSLNFSARAPPDFLGNKSNQLSMRPEMPLLGFLWSEAVLPNLWSPSKDTTRLLSGSQPCPVLCL